MRQLLPFLMLFLSCRQSASTQPPSTATEPEPTSALSGSRRNANGTFIHVFVALCDNKYQGIVPVPKAIGNGQDPNSNLYWGCDNGVRTYFKKKSSDWTAVQTWKRVDSVILERILFRHKTGNAWLLADAYDGRHIKKTTIDFIAATAGRYPVPVVHGRDTLYFGGASRLAAYIGHDGLMDFVLPVGPRPVDTLKREAIVLACYSKKYFAPHLAGTGARPLLWTTHLMAPEAYTLHDALRVWLSGGSRSEVRTAAAAAYAKYQKCSMKAAMNLLTDR